jgi:hypothetical protein
MFLQFKRGGLAKWYAATPTGEWAWAERQGVYAWHRDPDTNQLLRVDYGLGDDRQYSDRNGMWRTEAHSGPRVRGMQEALLRYRQIPN